MSIVDVYKKSTSLSESDASLITGESYYSNAIKHASRVLSIFECGCEDGPLYYRISSQYYKMEREKEREKEYEKEHGQGESAMEVSDVDRKIIEGMISTMVDRVSCADKVVLNVTPKCIETEEVETMRRFKEELHSFYKTNAKNRMKRGDVNLCEIAQRYFGHRAELNERLRCIYGLDLDGVSHS